MEQLGWLRELEIKDLLDGDTALIAEECGVETLLRLWEKLPRVNLYISTKPLFTAKKRYIKQKFDGTNAKKLSLLLGVSEKFVQDALDETKELKQSTLF